MSQYYIRRCHFKMAASIFQRLFLFHRLCFSSCCLGSLFFVCSSLCPVINHVKVLFIRFYVNKLQKWIYVETLIHLLKFEPSYTMFINILFLQREITYATSTGVIARLINLIPPMITCLCRSYAGR
jgi:hypothetical protein